MNFNYAISQAQTLYDIDGDLEDLQEIGLIAYNKIGNKNSNNTEENLITSNDTGFFFDLKIVIGIYFASI